jgi:hypothetical protein
MATFRENTMPRATRLPGMMNLMGVQSSVEPRSNSAGPFVTEHKPFLIDFLLSSNWGMSTAHPETTYGEPRSPDVVDSSSLKSKQRDLNPRPPEPYIIRCRRGSCLQSHAKSHMTATEYIESRELVCRRLRRETYTNIHHAAPCWAVTRARGSDSNRRLQLRCKLRYVDATPPKNENRGLGRRLSLISVVLTTFRDHYDSDRHRICRLGRLLRCAPRYSSNSIEVKHRGEGTGRRRAFCDGFGAGIVAIRVSQRVTASVLLPTNFGMHQHRISSGLSLAREQFSLKTRPER